jgi:hypothetical protein
VFTCLGISQAILTYNTTMVDPMCPSTLQFTCIGQDIGTLGWFFNGTLVVRYVHMLGDENRLPFNVEYEDDLGPVEIIHVQSNATSDGINVTATFTANTSVLEDLSNIQCGTGSVKSNFVNVSFLGKYNLWYEQYWLYLASSLFSTAVLNSNCTEH